MPWGVDEIELITFTRKTGVVERYALRLDGNPALAFDVEGVQYLGIHFSIGKAAAGLNESVRQGGFTVVDVGNNREIADMAKVAHRIGSQINN